MNCYCVFMFLQNHSRGLLLEGSPVRNLYVYEQLFFAAMFDFGDFQNNIFGKPFSATKASKEHDSELQGISLSRPCFPLKHSNYYLCRCDLLFFSRSFVSSGLTQFLFLLLFCVLFLPKHLYHHLS